jgi:hypothetical protein
LRRLQLPRDDSADRTVHDQRIDLYDDVLLLRLAVRRLAAVLT